MREKATDRMAIVANSAVEAIQKSGLAANSYHRVEAENVGINQWIVTRYRHFGVIEDSTNTAKEKANRISSDISQGYVTTTETEKEDAKYFVDRIWDAMYLNPALRKHFSDRCKIYANPFPLGWHYDHE